MSSIPPAALRTRMHRPAGSVTLRSSGCAPRSRFENADREPRLARASGHRQFCRMTGILLAADATAIGRAAQLLCEGRLVAFPTETVYGLGGDATSDAAVARIFAAKGRPRFNPLIVHVPGLGEAEVLAAFDERTRVAARRFWPGPLSLVLPRRPECG